jgi:hypothetical protein
LPYQKLVEVLLVFKTAGVDTAFPIADIKGEFVHDVSESVVVLFEFLPVCITFAAASVLTHLRK